jgi:hypothetical protein
MKAFSNRGLTFSSHVSCNSVSRVRPIDETQVDGVTDHPRGDEVDSNRHGAQSRVLAQFRSSDSGVESVLGRIVAGKVGGLKRLPLESWLKEKLVRCKSKSRCMTKVLFVLQSCFIFKFPFCEDHLVCTCYSGWPTVERNWHCKGTSPER